MGYAGYTPDAGCVDCRRLNPVRVVGINNAVRVNTTGQGVTCAILSDSTVRCWGVSLIPGAEVTCIRKWGSEYDPRFETHQPVLLRDIDGGALYGITKVFTTSSVGSGRTCTLDMYGRLSCVIGESPAVPLLEPFVGTQNCELFVPVEVPFCASRFRMAQGGYAFRLRDGTARVLATANDAGALGTGDYEPAYAFREVSGLHDAEEVEIEGLHGCATLTDGGFRCWGDNTWGQLGDGTYVSRPAP